MKRISLHGGHSGQFCSHAENSLEEIVQEYIRQGFHVVGITEHSPPLTKMFLYPDECAAGETPETLFASFTDYILEARRLQKKYAESTTVYVGIELEHYSGYQEFAQSLIRQFQPDYVVGSLHHCQDIPFDFSPGTYAKAVENVGGIDALYQSYFDEQYAMLECLKPEVVGHFDLIRIFDPDYQDRLQKPAIWKRIERNLVYIKELESILDYNQRALFKGADEPYISQAILELAIEMKILVVPGDDSHGIHSIGCFITEAIQYLYEMGILDDTILEKLQYRFSDSSTIAFKAK